DRERGDDGVVVAGQEARDDAVPVLGDDLAILLHLGAERPRDVDVEAGHMVVLVDEVEGRIGALGRDLDAGRGTRAPGVPAIARPHRQHGDENDEKLPHRRRPTGRESQRLPLRNWRQRSDFGLPKTWVGGPSSSILPWCRKTTWEATSRAKLISWVTTIMVV